VPPTRRFGLGGLPREVAVLGAVAFCVALGFGIVATSLSLFAKSFGVSNLWAGSVIAVFAAFRFLAAPGAGWLVNRTGERLVLASGIAIVAASSLVAGLSQSFWQLFVLRGLGGVGSAMFTVSASALLLRVVEPQQRGRATSVYQAGFLIGGITGPLFGTLLTSISLRLPFFVYTATLVAAGLIGLVFLSQSQLRAREQRVGTTHAPTSLHQAVRSRAYLAAVINNFATGWGLFGLRMSLLPLFVTAGLGLGVRWVGIGLLVSALTQGLLLAPAGWFSDTRGRRPALLSGAALLTVSFLLLGTMETQVSYLLSMAVFGMGSALLGTTSTAVVGDVIGGRGGAPISVFQMASDAGAVIGPLVAGYLSDIASYSFAFLVTAAIAGFGVVAAAVMPETLRPQVPERAATVDGQPTS
jgi:MFS family permease